MRKSIQSCRLYVITDQKLSDKTHLEIAEEAIAGGADVIQLRDKRTDSGKLYRIARELRELTRVMGISFIVNDRIDIALAVKADGVHLGQDDIEIPVAREIIGRDMILGCSATTLGEAQKGEADGADYLGVGPIFEARNTKPDAKEPQGLQLLEQVKKHCTIPVVAIGGINEENALSVFDAGADCIAVISAIVASKNIKESTYRLKQKIDKDLRESQKG